MADNVAITPGTGDTVAADDVSGVKYQRVKLDIGGDGASTPVTDLSTSALQTTGNTSLSSIDTKTPSLGQALAAASTPVVLTAAQITTLTPPAAITNFANETGGNLATLAGAITSSVLQANVKQINGVTVLMGNGVTGTGSQRVTIASDNTAFSVNATLSAETTKVIGVTRTADGSGNLLTSTTNALDVNLKTSSITLTISGAVTEATLDAALISQEATTSGIKGLTAFGAVTTNAPSYTTVKSDALSLTPAGGLRIDLKDTASNTNNINVNLAASAATVTVGTHAVTVASGGIASGAVASGAVASGAVASGAFASGSISAGAVAAGATSFVKLEDVASADADAGVPALAVRKGTPANTSGTDGDYEFLQISAGRLWASSNIDQINGITPLMGNGVTGTGSLRVTVASDNTAFSVNATLSAETTKVIGVTRSADGSGNLLTSTTNALDVNLKTSSITLNTSDAVTSTVTPADKTGSGSISALNGAVMATTNGCSIVSFNISGTWSATLLIEGTIDGGSTWIAIDGDVDATDTIINNTTVNGLVTVNCASYNQVRLRANPYTSGTANVTWSANQGLSLVEVFNTNGNSLRVQDLASATTGGTAPTSAQLQGNLSKTALPTAVTDGQMASNMGDKFGRQVILNNALRDIVGSQTTTISASTAETTIITAAASVFNDLLSLFISNTSATAARVDIRNATGGSIIFQVYVPAGDVRGVSLTTPWPQAAVNNNWTAQSSASVTDLRVSALFVKNA